jgi:hypothetical protein
VKLGRFVTLVQNSGLIQSTEIQKIAEAFQEGCREHGKEASAESFGDFLVETDRLTRWQCEKLRVGKYKGFYLDSYTLLGQVGKGLDYASYKARDTRTDEVVCLVVTPINRTGRRIEYRVEPFIQ